MPGSQLSLAKPQSRLLRPCGLNALIHRVLRSSIADRSADPASVQIYDVHASAEPCINTLPVTQCGMQLLAMKVSCWQAESQSP